MFRQALDSWSFEQWWEDLEWKLELEVHQLWQVKIAAQWLKSVFTEAKNSGNITAQEVEPVV